MLALLIKIFVKPFYKANAGFFLFFFFFFFGVVNGSSLLSYHQSLMLSMLKSPVILAGVMILWLFYFLKCMAYCKSIINSTEGNFLYNLQIISAKKQTFLFLLIYTLLYTPVVMYSIVVCVAGFAKDYYASAIAVLLFQLLIYMLAGYLFYKRINNWLINNKISLNLVTRIRKPFAFYLLYFFGYQKKVVFLSIKTLSFFLLYIVLVINRNDYSNDSFILFYQVILLLHSVFAFLAVSFLEKELSFLRNLPLSLFNRATMYLFTYAILLFPEFLYLFINGSAIISFTTIVAYYSVAVATLFLLSAIQFAEAIKMSEFLKVVFAIFFVSTFALHAKAFVLWFFIELIIACLLFFSSYYKYEADI